MRKIIITIIAVLSLCSCVFAEDTLESTISKTASFTNELDTFTSSIISSAQITEGQKRDYDRKIEDFDEYLKSDGIYLMNYAYYRDKGIIEENDYALPAIAAYNAALRRYKINSYLYINHYRDLAGYLANYTKLEVGTYSLDGMSVKKVADDYVEIDLTDADYSISNNSSCYGYGLIKVTSPNGNTYIFTGYDPYGDWNGFFVPTGKGLLLNCEYNGRKKILLNTENKPKLCENESVMLSEVFFDRYLKQSSVNFSYKQMEFSGDGKGNYTIKLRKDNPLSALERDGTIHDEYFEGGSGDSGKLLVIATDDKKYQYYWNVENAQSSAFDELSNLTIFYKDKQIKIIGC